MVSIYAPVDFHQRLNDIIQQEERLIELVRLVDYLEERPVQSADNLLVKKDEIWPLIDWYNILPPFLLPESIPLNASNLLGLVYAKLHNYEKAYALLRDNNPSLLKEIDFINRLQQGLSVLPGELGSLYTPFEEYRLMHNQAIVIHYAVEEKDFDLNKAKYFYLEALQAAPNDEYRAYTARQFAALLMDSHEVEDAERVLNALLAGDLSTEARTSLKQVLCQVWMQQLSVPYDNARLEQLKKTLWEILQVYEKENRSREQALILTDAGIIAHYSESWAESLGYFNKAIALFEKENIPELAAQAQYHKGTLLATWAQHDNPQFFRPAAEAYQKTVQVFTKESAPETYADIQHQLGIIYAEIPDEVKKKSIWAAVSSSAFQEVLQIYTKEAYPYQYAAVCNSYGNALVKYPEAKLSDNQEKALFYYQEALAIRTADTFPLERSLTLLNYLEAQWYLGMEKDQLDKKRYAEMQQIANEVLTLDQGEALVKEAYRHLDQLEQLRLAYS
jgi:tetratricopeptide (TPR) repeat protein